MKKINKVNEKRLDSKIFRAGKSSEPKNLQPGLGTKAVVEQT